MEKQKYIIYKAYFEIGKNVYFKILPGQEPELIKFDEFEQALKAEEKYMIKSTYSHMTFKTPAP